MAGYAHHQRDGLAGALALIFSSTVPSGQVFFFGLCGSSSLRINNPGSAAYKRLLGTVIAYGPSSGFPPPPNATIPQPITTDDLASHSSQTYDRRSRRLIERS